MRLQLARHREVRATAGIFGTERGFTGQVFDGGTGLGFYNARYYDTALGRFISPDSIVPDPAQPGLFNRFVYVSNNPLIYTDPTGHCKRVFGKMLPCPKPIKAAIDLAADLKDDVGRGIETASALFGEQVATTQSIQYTDGFGDAAVAKAGVANSRSLLGRTLKMLNGPIGAVTLGIGPYDILSTVDLTQTDFLINHELQHLREIDAYGALIWHGTYQAEQAFRIAQWLGGWADSGFTDLEPFKKAVHNRIGKEPRAGDVAFGNVNPIQATQDAFPWSPKRRDRPDSYWEPELAS